MAASNQPETRGYRSYLKPGETLPRLPTVPATVALAELTADRKRDLWTWMQANDPATADYLASMKTNADIAELEAAFGPVRPVVSIDYIRKAIG